MRKKDEAAAHTDRVGYTLVLLHKGGPPLVAESKTYHPFIHPSMHPAQGSSLFIFTLCYQIANLPTCKAYAVVESHVIFSLVLCLRTILKQTVCYNNLSGNSVNGSTFAAPAYLRTHTQVQYLHFTMAGNE